MLLVQKNNMKKLILLLFSMLIPFTSFGNTEISLFNSNGEAVAYIAVDDDLTIYLWSGEPVAYIDDEDVYGFNGKHLGWFSESMIINHNGESPCVLKNRYPGYTQYEGYKSYKSYKPYKSYQQYAPYKPYTSNRFSSTPCSLFLAMGK
jgi:hypothetical protein